MPTRRKFIISSAIASAAAMIGIKPSFPSPVKKSSIKYPPSRKPVVISTWNHGIPANAAAWEILSKNGRALDAVENGVRVTESDPKITSVGYGGWPDRDGHVTLDACIMDENLNGGSVAFLEHIKNPISVARLVMEKTPHVMLVGEGALQYALENGFKKENLLTEESKRVWQEWLKKHNYKPIDENNHDTIGMVALDNSGNLSGACTTSGMAWKIHGRVGDSPILGAGLYVDNEVGGAASTGVGEAVMRTCGSYLVVELMRGGKSPDEACKIAVERIMNRNMKYDGLQVGFIALNKNGEVGGYAIKKGFQYAVYAGEKNELIDVKAYES
ncbi:MAG TPA: N(4)-(beta-N-acetylglucosaminyl)-L-asparaginase [Ignavibacteriaceae bacterium]|nr:N(4)-(beta-N-acetylglucosaminyl)-L-asparaginase [Ignavibacteriaceae bacterium]